MFNSLNNVVKISICLAISKKSFLKAVVVKKTTHASIGIMIFFLSMFFMLIYFSKTLLENFSKSAFILASTWENVGLSLPMYKIINACCVVKLLKKSALFRR